jgi:hypothetical protein
LFPPGQEGVANSMDGGLEVAFGEHGQGVSNLQDSTTMKQWHCQNIQTAAKRRNVVHIDSNAARNGLDVLPTSP